jgi:hypothetical protein
LRSFIEFPLMASAEPAEGGYDHRLWGLRASAALTRQAQRVILPQHPRFPRHKKKD